MPVSFMHPGSGRWEPTLSVRLFQSDQLLTVSQVLLHKGTVDIWLSFDECRRGTEG